MIEVVCIGCFVIICEWKLEAQLLIWWRSDCAGRYQGKIGGWNPVAAEIILFQVVIALRYLATNAHQEVLADTIGVSQKTVSNAVKKVVKALNHPAIVRKFIRCRPNSSEFCRRSARNFARLGRFPNVIGAIDGCCIKIDKPAHSGWQYYCRKGYTAINVLAVVNARGRFVYVNANFPGSVHDSSVYAYSSLKHAIEHGRALPGYCLVGDCGFPNGNDIITPFRNPSTRQELSYNKWHKKMRVVVECVFGTWKRKFAILRDGIRVKPRRAADIIIACAVLHNMMMDMGCLRPRALGRRIAVCRHPPRDCADIRSYLVGMMWLWLHYCRY